MFPETGMQACFVDIVLLLVLQSIYFIYKYSLIFSENSISSICLTETYVHETMYLYDDISPMKEYVASHMY